MLLLVMPLLTMRLISEEKRTGTLTLLLSAPVSLTEIVIGKYLGVIGFILIMLLLMALMPLSLLLGGNLDFGMIASGFLALLLLVASVTSVGLYMSTLTSQPTIAAISSFGLILLFWVIDWSTDFSNQSSNNVIHYLSMLRHYQPLISGIFKSSDVIYYLLFIITFLVLSIRRLDADRLQH
jgi:ABC-2 type transport system permease protein